MRAVFILAAAILVGLVSSAHAQDEDIRTTYFTEPGTCPDDDGQLYKISEGLILGPDLNCSISNEQPAGTGLVAFSAECEKASGTFSGNLALDLGNYADHFEMYLPDADQAIKLYPCTPIPGLE